MNTVEDHNIKLALIYEGGIKTWCFYTYVINKIDNNQLQKEEP